MPRWLVVLATLTMLLGTATAASAEKRVALIVGISKYRHVPELATPPADARLIARTLSDLGFRIVGGGPQLDLDKSGLESVIQRFGSELQGADVGLFYYAGHGIQVRGNNYLLPVGANPSREADIDFQMQDMSVVLRQMESSGTRLNLVLLDACRNNPLSGRGLRSSEGGLAQMRAPEGTLISFATQPGNVAQDGDGNSPYAKALAQTVSQRGLGVFDVFNSVGLSVKRQTDGYQQPWVSSSPIDGNFYFAGRSDAPPQPVAAPAVDPSLSPARERPPVQTTSPVQAPSKANGPVAAPPPDKSGPPVDKPQRELTLYDGSFAVTSNSLCPHESASWFTIKNGVVVGKDLRGRIRADGTISGSFGGLFPGSFSGRMLSADAGAGHWSTRLGCTGRWSSRRA